MRPEVLFSRTDLFLLTSPTNSQASPTQVLCSHNLHVPSLGPLWSQGARWRLPGLQKNMPWKQCQRGLSLSASLQKPVNLICLQCKMSPLLLLPHKYRVTNRRVWVDQDTEWVFLVEKVFLFSVVVLLLLFGLFWFGLVWFDLFCFALFLNCSNRRINRPTLLCRCDSYFIPHVGYPCPN